MFAKFSMLYVYSRPYIYFLLYVYSGVHSPICVSIFFKSDNYFLFLFIHKSLDYYLTIQHALPSSDEESRYGLFVFILIKPTSINRSRLKDNTSGIKRTLGDIHMSLNTRRFWIVWSKRKKNTICCMYIK